MLCPSNHKRQRTPSVEILSSPPTHSTHCIRTSSQRSLKKQKSHTMQDCTPSLGHSLSPPTTCNCHTSSSAAIDDVPSPLANGQSKPLSIARHHVSVAVQHSQHVWPFDFYADEMDIRFRACRLESNKQRPVEQVFRGHFHVKFAKSTFYDHHHHWMSASDTVWACYIGYGHTKCGCWTSFLRHEIKGEQHMGHF